mmetsp:Transcript_26178/g.40582  ORF Transcript_26178/g.40582 Transcript_26178/m.40582 type:complete len:175 (+) Transcript_26178:108-632(+)
MTGGMAAQLARKGSLEPGGVVFKEDLRCCCSIVALPLLLPPLLLFFTTIGMVSKSGCCSFKKCVVAAPIVQSGRCLRCPIPAAANGLIGGGRVCPPPLSSIPLVVLAVTWSGRIYCFCKGVDMIFLQLVGLRKCGPGFEDPAVPAPNFPEVEREGICPLEVATALSLFWFTAYR